MEPLEGGAVPAPAECITYLHPDSVSNGGKIRVNEKADGLFNLSRLLLLQEVLGLAKFGTLGIDEPADLHQL